MIAGRAGPAIMNNVPVGHVLADGPRKWVPAGPEIARNVCLLPVTFPGAIPTRIGLC